MKLRRLAGTSGIVLLALFFLGAGVPKLLDVDTPNGGSKADFQRWGYPAEFRRVVGAGETLGAVLRLVGGVTLLGAPLRFWGALGLAADMAGALATNLVHGEGAPAALPLILLIVCAAVATTRRPAWLRRGAPAAV